MKRCLFFSFIFLLVSSCISPEETGSAIEDEFQEGDISHIIITMLVCDEEGNNYLDPDYYSNFIQSESFFVEYDNSKYYLNQDFGESSPSEAYGVFIGLFSEMIAGIPYLRFGWLDGKSFIDNKEISIHWPNGQTDCVTIFNRFDWKNYKVERKFYLNGKETGETISFVF